MLNDGTPNELKTAADLRRAGRLNEAECIYLDLLAANPNNPAAHYELGTLLHPEDVEIRIDSLRRPRVVELHTMTLNCLCELIEHSLFGSYNQD